MTAPSSARTRPAALAAAPSPAPAPAAAQRLPAVPSLERRRLRIYLVQMLLDIAVILGGFAAVGELYLDYRPLQFALLQAQLLLPLYLTLALYQGVYSIGALRDWRYAARRVLAALVLAAALLLFVTFYTKSTAQFSRVVFTGGVTASALLLVAGRWLTGRWIERWWGRRVVNALLIDAGGPAVALPHAIRIDAAAAGLVPDMGNPHALDRLGRALLNMDRVVVSCTQEHRVNWASCLRGAGVRGELVTEPLEDIQPLGLAVEKGWRALIVSNGPLGLRERILKRGFDVALAGAGLVATAPLMLAVAALIRLEDGGPVLFVQRRLGRGNRFFDMLKFRSMRVAAADGSGTRSAAREDDRVTRIGRFIRRTSIDELPQLVNVLRGEMSMVGPRPHALGSQAGDKLFWEVDGAYWHRHTLKPGLTGLAQVRGLRGATDAESDLTDRLAADLEYIARWSLWGDALIVLRTLGVLIHRRAF